MQAGDMRYLAQFYERAPVPDGGGGQLEQWLPFYKCWAAVNPLGIPERYQAVQTEEQGAYRIVIRQPDVEITHQHRVQIQQIRPDLLDIRSVEWSLPYLAIQADEVMRGV